MRFDVIIGNPPYGKCSNLAIKFLNKSEELSDNIWYVLPKTFRKTSITNRISLSLHKVIDIDISNKAFSIGVTTCMQRWNKCNIERTKEYRNNTHQDFEFVNKLKATVALGRVGFGPSGKIYKDFQTRSENSHYFLKTKSTEVINKLISLQDKFRIAASNTVGNLSLSKSEIIRLYEEV
jgi:hypothetical protein